MRIAVAGSGRLAVSLIRPLAESSHELVAVVQNGRETKGLLRRRAMPACLSVVGGGSSATGFAVRNQLPIVWIDKMLDDIDPLRKLEPDILLVGGFNIILKRPLLDLPRIGCVNTHSSLLPRHRGPNPFAAVLMAGEEETGVTFHIMDEGIDTGDIIEQSSFPVDPKDNALKLYMKACERASERVVEVMDRIERDGLDGVPQDEQQATYDQKPTDETAFIDWTQPGEYIERFVRALNPFLMARFKFRKNVVKVARAAYDNTSVNAEPGTVVSLSPRPRIAAGKGTVYIRVAYCKKPVPSIWPSPWSRPKVGERLGFND